MAGGGGARALEAGVRAQGSGQPTHAHRRSGRSGATPLALHRSSSAASSGTAHAMSAHGGAAAAAHLSVGAVDRCLGAAGHHCGAAAASAALRTAGGMCGLLCRLVTIGATWTGTATGGETMAETGAGLWGTTPAVEPSMLLKMVGAMFSSGPCHAARACLASVPCTMPRCTSHCLPYPLPSITQVQRSRRTL